MDELFDVQLGRALRVISYKKKREELKRFAQITKGDKIQ